MASRHDDDPAIRLELANRDLRRALWECRAQLARLKDLLDRRKRQDNGPPGSG